jgi:hypothetical protein
LVDKLSGNHFPETQTESALAGDSASLQNDLRSIKSLRSKTWRSIPAEPIRNLAEELLANRNLLASLVGPAVCVTVDVQGGALPIRMTSEDLARVLVNLA